MAGGSGVNGAQRFFVSYTGGDVQWAEWVAWTLENEGHDVLIQVWDFGTGSHFVGEMHRAVSGERRVVAVLSDAYLRSAFAAEEWQAVWAADPGGSKRQLLVVRIEDCDRPGLLRQVVSVDLFGIGRDVARQRLLEAITPRRRKPEMEPNFPAEMGEPATATSSSPALRPPLTVPAARSAYLEQVRQFAPPVLIGREKELAQLTEFCTALEGSTSSTYMWWQAVAWAGKSALLSRFVLDPPAGVRLVSFFITARYTGNSNRAAFVDIVTEQLAEILGESVPPFQAPARRERLWFRFFADAAALCQQRGQRLVLVVDGLDEDRGVTGPGARSIAGLLPAAPQYGARVVVSGRPNPPIPGDVAAGHPLREPGIIQILERSNHAKATKADMQADLHRLRTGSPLGCDLLGLVTAAGGGLSGRDLEELSTDPDVTEWDIEQLLATVAGRSFSSLAARWNPSTGPTVYLLGHEELQQDAIRSYGAKRLAAYRERLHAWARGYQKRRWPEDTPEYLLRGYYRLLLATVDLTRAVSYATDQARHDRMLDLSGGDAAALAEITDAQDAVLAQPTPDLALMARLAVHRQRIADRNSLIPVDLPAVWARLGHATRAEQIARAITDPGRQAEALVGVAGALNRVGEHAYAEQVATDAEQIARAITDPDRRAAALVRVAGALARSGDHARAEQVARTVTRPDLQAAELVRVSGALAQTGDHTHAVTVATDAEQVARTITNRNLQAAALVGAAGAFAQVGDRPLAVKVAMDAEQVARTITNPNRQAQALMTVAGAFAQAGDHSYAEQVARSITKLNLQAEALVRVAGALAQAGDHTHAVEVATGAEQVARTIANWNLQAEMLVRAAGALAQSGDHSRAEKVARGIVIADRQAEALVRVAGALAQSGDHSRAEIVARTITNPNYQAEALVRVAGALAQSGDHSRAEQIARTITNPNLQAAALVRVAAAFTRAGESAHAVEVATDAEQVARTIINPNLEAQALVRVAAALAQAGESAHAVEVATDAERVARTIINPNLQAAALVKVAAALAQAGDHTYAEQVARTITNRNRQGETLVKVAGALARSGNRFRAEQVARTITDPNRQVEALVRVAGELAQAGENTHAVEVATDAERLARGITEVLPVSRTHNSWTISALCCLWY